MDKLKYGIEIEGAIRRTDFSQVKRRLQNEHNLNEILINKKYDSSARVRSSPSTHEDEVEMVSSQPVTNIKEHLKHWNLLLNDLEFMYNPKKCGLHIHTSPVNSTWGKRYTTYMFNLFFTLSPFTRFFKNRREQQFCLAGERYSRLLRFFAEDVEEGLTKEEFIEKWDNALSKSEFNFRRRNMLRTCTRLDTIEIRLLPPEKEMLDTFIKLITRVWEVEGVLNASEMLEKSIFDVLKMFDLSQDLYKFKNYYEEWIK